jgi:GntR family transcriptional repressor for pyruvate dehydrogenase complex
MRIEWLAGEPLQSTRTGHDVASTIRAAIQSGELPVGAVLPSQRNLATALGVGRQSLREGIAQLEAEGYLVTRRGAQGGSFVIAPSTPMSIWRELLRVNLPDLLDIVDFRIAVERRMCELAALRRTDAHLSDMRKAIEDLPAHAPSYNVFREADGRFHAAVARAANSPKLELASRQARADLFIPTDNLPYQQQIEITRIQHTAIYQAIKLRDERAAGDAAVLHIESTRSHLHDLVNEEDAQS